MRSDGIRKLGYGGPQGGIHCLIVCRRCRTITISDQSNIVLCGEDLQYLTAAADTLGLLLFAVAKDTPSVRENSASGTVLTVIFNSVVTVVKALKKLQAGQISRGTEGSCKRRLPGHTR
jgi:hypothetical protein